MILNTKTLIGSMLKRRKAQRTNSRSFANNSTLKTRFYKEEMASYVDVLNMKVQESNMVREIEKPLTSPS